MTARLMAITVAIAVATGCVGPSRSDADYQSKASHTAEAMISAVQTAGLTSRLAARGKTTAAYASLALSRAERDADAVVASFEVVQPPSERSDRLRAELLAVLDGCTSVLSNLRITARRGTLDDLPAIAADLQELRRRLDRFTRPAPA